MEYLKRILFVIILIVGLILFFHFFVFILLIGLVSYLIYKIYLKVTLGNVAKETKDNVKISNVVREAEYTEKK